MRRASFLPGWAENEPGAFPGRRGACSPGAPGAAVTRCLDRSEVCRGRALPGYMAGRPVLFNLRTTLARSYGEFKYLLKQYEKAFGFSIAVPQAEAHPKAIPSCCIDYPMGSQCVGKAFKDC